MQNIIVAFYCAFDDLLTAMHPTDDSQSNVSSAQVMIAPIVVCAFFDAKFERIHSFSLEHDHMMQLYYGEFHE